MAMIDYKDADKLLRDAIGSTSNLKTPDNFYRHSIGVAETAYFTALRLSVIGKKSDSDLVRVSGLLHDIGKAVVTPESKQRDPELIFDCIHGYKYLMEQGLDEIARTILPGFTLKELMELEPEIFPEYAEYELDPVTWEQKLVVYGDCHTDGRGEPVTFEDRIRDIKHRYQPDSLLIRSLREGGEDRLMALSEEINALMP
jgi:putative nucleotidyltransferase with HDIG domain